MSSSDSLVTGAWTIDDVVRCFPRSLDVLNRFGLDGCCVRSLTLDECGECFDTDVNEIIDALRGCTADYEPPTNEQFQSPSYHETSRTA